MSLINPCKNDIILITICQVNNYKMLKKKKMKIVVSSINEKCKIHMSVQWHVKTCSIRSTCASPEEQSEMSI